MTTQLDRIEAMLAEVLRRQTPPEGVPAMLERLRAYHAGDVPNIDQLGRWIIGPAITETREA